MTCARLLLWTLLSRFLLYLLCIRIDRLVILIKLFLNPIEKVSPINHSAWIYLTHILRKCLIAWIRWIYNSHWLLWLAFTLIEGVITALKTYGSCFNGFRMLKANKQITDFALFKHSSLLATLALLLCSGVHFKLFYQPIIFYKLI